MVEPEGIYLSRFAKMVDSRRVPAAAKSRVPRRQMWDGGVPSLHNNLASMTLSLIGLWDEVKRGVIRGIAKPTISRPIHSFPTGTFYKISKLLIVLHLGTGVQI